MIPVHGKPLLEYIIEGIIQAGIKEFVLVVGYKMEQIMDHFQDGSRWGISVDYVEQKTLNGTGGALLLCEDLIQEEHFFLTWGDILVPYRIYKKVYEIYERDKEDFILVTNYLDNLSKGCAIHCEGKYCTEMVEKPKPGTYASNLNNCGIFIFSRGIFEELKKLEPSKRGELEIPNAIKNGIKHRGWKVRIVKMKKGQFRGDFGDKKEYERLKAENRLTTEATGNNTDSSMNFKPKMEYKELMDGYHKIINNIYSVKPYYKRLKQLLLNYNRRYRNDKKINPILIIAFIKSMLIIGVFSKGRTEYWKLIIWTLFHKPGLFSDAITFAVYGYHFRTVYGLRQKHG